MNRNQDPNWLKDISTNLLIEIGKTSKNVSEILQWRKGTTIKLEDSTINILRVYVNNHYYAYGDVLRNVDGEMSLRITNILLNERELKNVSENTNM